MRFRTFDERNQYDEFLHKIQQLKMKEIWDNGEDEELGDELEKFYKCNL